MTSRVIAVLLPLALIPFAPAQDAAALKWERSVDEALRRAAAEKKPVLWCIMKDKEVGCRRMLEGVYTDAAVKLKLAEFVLLPCSTSMHVAAEVGADGKLSTPCTQFHGVTCGEHQAIERIMREKFQETAEVIAPQHIVSDATGRLIVKKPYEMKTPAFVEWLDRALLKFADPAAAADSRPAPATEAKPAPADGKEAPKDPYAKPAAWSHEVQPLIQAVIKSDGAAREAAVKDLMRPVTDERCAAFLDLVNKTFKESKDRGVIIRALGYAEFSPAAPAVLRLLEAKDTHVRNCAVVTLEEMENATASEPLLKLHKQEKDSEIRKDCVRALGPAGGGKPEVKAMLLKELGSDDEKVRSGAAMSLGKFLAGDDEVKKAMKDRFKKESSGIRVKTAILWGVSQSGDGDVAAIIDAMMTDENNGQLKQLAEGLKRGGGGMNGPPDDGGGEDGKGGRGGGQGGGGGGRGGRGGAGGGGWRLLRLLAPLYADDKIVRNRIREFRERAGGRGG